MLRITLLFVALLSLSTTAFSQKEKKADSKIDQVTVFLQGAQIKEKGKFSADKGVTKIIFEGMAPHYDQQSIQIKGKGDYIILDVSPRMYYPEPSNATAEEMPAETRKALRLLNDSIEDMQWKVKEIDFELTSLSMEKNMLLNSGSVKNQTAKDSLLALTNAMAFMRTKLNELNKLQLKAERNKQQMQADLNRMNTRKMALENYAQQGSYGKPAQQATPQVVVTISADAPVTGTLELSYMVQQAGWTPAYDLRADDINSPVSLTYKANVFQTTGVDWKDVKLKLSTINPNRSNVKPTLAPWYLAYVQPIRPVPTAQYNNAYKGPADRAESITMDSEESAKHIAQYTTMTESMTMVEFDLKLPFSSFPS